MFMALEAWPPFLFLLRELGLGLALASNCELRLAGIGVLVLGTLLLL